MPGRVRAGDRKMTRKLKTAITMFTMLASAVTVAIKLYDTYNSRLALKSREKKLDQKLEDSMDCSDAVASY